jgi:hypothetical protein
MNDPHNQNQGHYEWGEWKGTMSVKMQTAEDRLEELESKLSKVEDKVAEIVAKLTVPLWLAGIGGPIIGAVIVAAVTRAMK